MLVRRLHPSAGQAYLGRMILQEGLPVGEYYAGLFHMSHDPYENRGGHSGPFEQVLYVDRRAR